MFLLRIQDILFQVKVFVYKLDLKVPLCYNKSTLGIADHLKINFKVHLFLKKVGM